MKKLAFLIGILAVFLFAGMVRGATVNCTNCSDCNTKIASASTGDIVQLNISVVNQAGTCVNFAGKDNIIFDCLGNTIDGNRAGNNFYGISMPSGTNNNTVRNCNITDFSGEFSFGVYEYSSNYNNFSNMSLNYNDYAIWIENSNNNNLFNFTAKYNDIGVYLSSSSNNTVDGVVSISNLDAGVFTTGSSNYNFISNVVGNGTTRNNYFLWISSGNYNTITNVTTNTNWYGGISNGNGAYYNSYINIISNSAQYGIRFGGRYCNYTNVSVSSNNIGFYTMYGQYNIIKDSRITNNSVGIYFEGYGTPAMANNVTNTTFNNTANFGSNQLTNGNYFSLDSWSSPTGTGYSEACPDLNANGICDSSYSLDGNNTDYSPRSVDSLKPSMAFVSQSPNDVNNFNVFGNSVNATYNLTDKSSLNSNSVKFYFKTNSTSDCWYFVNGTSYCGFNQGASMSNSSDLWTFRVFDNQVYPATYNVNETVMESTSHSSYTVSGHDSYVKIRFFNVSMSKQYSLFEVMANDSGTGTALGIFYCNSSYSSGDPALSDSCASFYNINGNVLFNHTHGAYSSHHVVPFAVNLTTGKVGNVTVTPLSYFLLRGNTSDWHAYHININSSSVQTTTDAGGAWTDRDWTVDAHLHQYSDSDMLWYYIYSCDGVGSCGNSSFRYDLVQLYGLPPIAPDVYSPVPGSYTNGDFVDIEYTESISPNSYAVESYNITLVDSTDNSFVEQIVDNNYPYFSYSWQSDLSGDFKIKVESCDNHSQCSVGYSEIFMIGLGFGERQGLARLPYYGYSLAGFFTYITNPLVDFLLAMGIIGVILAIVYSIGQGVINRMNGGVAG